MKRPLSLKLAVVSMLILALVLGGLAAARQFGLAGRPGGNVMVINGGGPGGAEFRTPGERPDFESGGSVLPNDGSLPEIQIEQGGATGPQRVFPGGGTRVRGMGGIGGFGLFGSLQNWLGMGLGVLGLLGAFLLWKPSRWGIVLAVLISVAAVAMSLPSLLTLPMLRMIPALAWTLLPTLLQGLLAVLVLVLALLPATRAAVGRPAATADDEVEERVVL
jgi:hypothetical protein